MFAASMKQKELKNADIKKWEKQGDFLKDLPSYSDQSYLRSVYYYFNEKKEHLHLGRSFDHNWQKERDRRKYGDYYFAITFKSDNAELANKIFNAAKQQKLPVKIFTESLEFTVQLKFDMPTQSKEAFIRSFIKVIDNHFPLDNDLKREIYKVMHIKDEFYKELTALVDKGKFDTALEEAQSFKDNDILWELGNYCESRNELTNAIRCYESIGHDNPHYHDALERIAEALIKQNASLERQLENRWKMKKSAENQRWIDEAFHKLSGGKDLADSLKEVQPDINTLIALAKTTASLREENAELTQRAEKIRKLAGSILFKPASQEKKQEAHPQPSQPKRRASF